MGKKVQGMSSINGRYRIGRGRLNGEAKELLYMTHGHELRWGNDGGRRSTGWREIKEKIVGQF